MSAQDAQSPTRNPVARFFLVPFEARTYRNLLYLALAFPLGLAYFIFLTVGLPLGLGLSIIWIGLPILALVFLGSWGLTAIERYMAIGLLGAEIPPMAPPSGIRGQGFWESLKAFLQNPVTWTGMFFLFFKLPLGVLSFTALVTLFSVTLSFLLVPVAYAMDVYGYYEFFDVYGDGLLWWADTPFRAMLCGMIGVLLIFVSLHLLNGLAAVWRLLAAGTLGNERFTAPPPAADLPEPAPAV